MSGSPCSSAQIRSVTGRCLGIAALCCGALASGLFAAAAMAAEPTPRDRDEAAIKAAARTYLDALGRGDGKACAALWTPDGDIVDDLGAVLPGRETVAATAPPPADAPRPEVRLGDTTIRFLTADVAIEDGTVEIGPAGGEAMHAGRFSATWVRHDDAWKLAALREARAPAQSGVASLRQLDWMVGDWVGERRPAGGGPDAEAGPAIELSVRWNETKTFLVRDMKLTPPANAAGRPLTISQRVGWDPLGRRIRSWAFGSDGSHAEATWLRDDDGSWVASTMSVRPDGSQTTSINVYTYDGKSRCVWRSIPTHVGAEHATPISITLVRKPGSPTP